LAVPVQLFEDRAFASPARPIDAAQALAISPAMQHYLAVEIAPQIRRRGRQQGLVEALYDHAQLRLEYDTELTRTAAEAFEARAGNCLSLVLMTAALAKQLKLPVTYQTLVGEASWGRSGDLAFAIGHVNITVAKRLVDRVQGLTEDTQLQLSFGVSPVGNGSRMRPVGEQTILAMFMNNRAAESLARGDIGNAYAYAREAVVQDPLFAGAYNTLGIIYQRHGLTAKSEQAYRYALDLDAASRPALSNLAGLVASQQRHGEAAALRARLARLEGEPPFKYYDLGRAAIRAGDYRSARDHLLREIERDPTYHEYHYWLAVALVGLGDTEQARQHLTQAMNHSTTRRDQAIYSAKLQRLAPTRTQ
jgi:Tfp pilus assembly protein PilF